MSKGAIVLSAVPSVIGGTLGQVIEHAQDKNLIIYCGTGTGGTAVVSNLAISNHTHGSSPTIIGPVTVVSSSNAWTVSISNYITTGALSNHTHGNIQTVAIAGSNLTYSSASDGLTLSIPNFLTTAALSNHSHTQYAGTGTTVTGANVTLNSNGLILDITGGGGAADGFNILAAGTQTAVSNTTVMFSNSNGVSFGMSGNSRITASYSQSTHDHPYISTVNSTLFQSVGAYLTTARASTDAIGLVTAGTNITWTANSDGLSINAAGYAGTTTAGTNVGLTVNSLGIRASVDTAGMTAAGDGVNIIAAGTVTASTVQTVMFENSNGISFGMHSDGSQVTAQHNAYSATSMFSASFLNSGEAHLRQIAASNSSYTSGSVQISGSNNITVSYNASTILISGPNTHAQQTGISALVVSDNTFTSGTVTLSNANGISFGSAGANIITASYTVPTQSVQPVAVSDSATSFTFSTLSFGAANGLTLYHNNSSIIGSYTVPAATIFSNSNNVSFGLNGSTVTASATMAQSDQPRVISLNGTTGALSLSGASNITVSALNGSTITIYGPDNILNSFSVGGNTGTTGSSAISGGGFVIAGGSNITLSQSNNSISIHGTPGIAVGQSDTLYTSGNVLLSGQANITINTTEVGGTQYLRLSVAAGTGLADGVNILAVPGSTAASNTTVILSNSNNVSFGLDGATVTASIPSYVGTGFTTTATEGTAVVGTADSNGLVLGVPAFITTGATGPTGMFYSASGTSTSASTMQFGNSNGVSFSLVNGSVVGTVATNYMASASSANFAGTGFSTSVYIGTEIEGTLGTNGLSMLVPAFLTTALPPGASDSFAKTGFSTSALTLGSLMTGILDTNGLYLGVPRYITTALATNAGTGFIGINTAGTNITWTANSSGLSINAGAYARTGATTNAVAGALMAMTLNTSGLNVNIPAFITTALPVGASVSFAGTGFSTGSTSGTNITGTLNTQGLSMRFPEYIHESESGNIYFSNTNGIVFGSSTSYGTAGYSTTITASLSTGSLYFSDTNGVTWSTYSTSNSTYVYVGSLVGGTGAGGSFSAGVTSLGNTLGSTGTVSNRIVFAGTNNITLSQSSNASGATVSIIGVSGTLAQSSHSHGNVSISSGYGGSTLALSSASNGLTLSVPAWLTTAAAGGITGVQIGSNTGGNSTLITSGVMTLAGGANITLSQNSAVSAGNAITIIGAAGSGANWELAGANTLGTTATSFNTLFLQGGNNVTLSGNSNTLVINVNATGANDGVNILAVSGSTAASTGTIAFYNANNFTFGFSDSTRITASFSQSTHEHSTLGFATNNHTHGNVSLSLSNISGAYSSASNGLTLSLTGGGGGAGSVVFSAGANSASLGSVVFSNSNNISFGLSGSTITGSIPVGTVYFQDANSFTFGSAVAGVSTSITGSFDYIAPRNIVISGNTSGTTAVISSGTLSLVGGSNITLVQNANTISINGKTDVAGTGTTMANATAILNTEGLNLSIANPIVLQGSGTYTQRTGTIQFATGNGITFGLNAGTMTASHNGFISSSQLTTGFLQLASSTRYYSTTSQFSASFLNTGEAHIRQFAVAGSSYTSGSVTSYQQVEIFHFHIMQVRYLYMVHQV